MLKPGGLLLLTVPYGRAEDHGWLVQFDERRLDDLLATANPTRRETTIYLHGGDGWQPATEAEAADASYHDVHADPERPADWAMAARAVACVSLRVD